MLSANFIIPLNYILWVKFTLITVNWLQGVPRILKQKTEGLIWKFQV